MQRTPMCEAVHDDLADLVAGVPQVVARHADHLASCDACRDARHDAATLAGVLGDAGRDHVASPDLADRVLARLDAAPAAVVAPTIEKPPVRDAAVTPIATRRRPRWIAAAAGVAAIAAGAVGYVATREDGPSGSNAATLAAATREPGKVTDVRRAAKDQTGGLRIADGNGGWRPLGKGDVLPAGAVLRTDDRTRVAVSLGDGTRVVLDHATELALGAGEARQLRVASGRIVADIAQVANRPASIVTPSGTIEVVGTKLAVVASAAHTSVQVVRGSVRVNGQDIRAGEEGLLEGGKLSVAAAPGLAKEVEWSELAPAAPDTATAGVGALRAYKPGEKRDRDWNLTLAQHDVKVRIAGPVARTEITEVFENPSDETLEGVYQFPLPADAQIDNLELDVEGGFESGAFVDKQRAAKIWQGVIDKATPKAKPRRLEEDIIWVQGPWRDPALLDWKRGGRFELRIFPIPAKGKRTIKISYTQVVTPRGPWRQYVYPLPHSSDGSTVANQFNVDVEVRGAAPGLVRAAGYGMTPDPARQDVSALTLRQGGFVPRGDLVIDYRAVDGDAELRAWTFTGGAAVAPDEKLAAKKHVGIDPVVVAAQRAIAADARPTAVLALRPKLPRWSEAKQRDYTIVVDTSQSMVGERHTRATQLASALVEQMDRRDRFAIMACDSECTKHADLQTPSATAAASVGTWLAAREAAGASDVVGAVRTAVLDAKATKAGDRERWILYIGDGFATTGFRRAGEVERAVANVAADGAIHVGAIGLGGDADAAVLSAVARGGGGSYLAWTPGLTVKAAAIAGLESTLGTSLRDAKLELPAGLADVAPTTLPTVRSGEELLVAARVTGDVAGEVVLKGKVGGQDFEQRYPVKLAVSSAAGNGFVPRLWATLAIEQLERAGRGEDRAQIVALSQGYGVMSKETSLLVLESAAMFEAFGVDRTKPTATWTGEEALEEVTAEGSIGYAGDAVAGGKADFAGADAASAAQAAPAPRAAEPPADFEDRPETKAKASRAAPVGMRGRGMIPMRRIWVRVPALSAYAGVTPSITKAIADAETALAASPDSRERHRNLVQALSYGGELERAREVALRWLERDRLDPQALGYLADLLGRAGDRDRALRTLSGLVDLDADRAALHERMVAAYDRTGRAAQACSHRIALATLQAKDAKVAGAALRCLRSLGRDRDADIVASSLVDDAARAAAEKAATVAPLPPTAARDVIAGARWQGNEDLDISIVAPDGTRVSWMGGRTDLVADDVTSLAREQLALRRIQRGNYLVEVSRVGGSTQPVRGTLDLTVLGQKRAVPFELTGPRATVARIAVHLEERLVRVDGWR